MELAETQVSVSRFSGSFKSCNGLALQEDPIKLDLPTKGGTINGATLSHISRLAHPEQMATEQKSGKTLPSSH